MRKNNNNNSSNNNNNNKSKKNNDKNKSSKTSATIIFSIILLALLSFNIPLSSLHGLLISHTFAHVLSVTTAPVKLCVQTGTFWWDGGSDADVHVRLFGPTGCKTPWVDLNTPKDNFEMGNYDCFEYHTKTVGYQVSY